MNKNFLQTLTVLVILLFTFPIQSYAHDLIPQKLKVYIQEHQNATPEEIKQFADEQTPEFAQKFRDGAEIVNMARNVKTSFFDNMFDFLKLGIIHILSGPDHVLFVLSLLLVFATWRDILKLTATFTVAHSITLILAGTGLLTLTPRIVEPMIALSIAYVAISTVFFSGKMFIGENRGKMAAVFFFGLFHGLGFAGLLKEIQVPQDKFASSLLSFNLGIEAGQLIIISLAFPLIFLFRKKKWYANVIKCIALLIAGVALLWFVQRIVAG